VPLAERCHAAMEEALAAVGLLAAEEAAAGATR
jgi:hypothetical protein